jgi:indolepyruvate ferredoxin oxidoreductase beta subunit
MLHLLAALRPLRRMSARCVAEQAVIERWLSAVTSAAARDLGVALEITLCGRRIKGYGDTHRRGKANFLRILETLVDGNAVAADRGGATAISKAREAALADPEGSGLEGTLATHGIVPLPPQSKPIQFMRRPAENRKVA